MQRVVRKGRVISVIDHAVRSKHTIPTMRYIAKAMDMTPSTYLMNLLHEMESEGLLIRSEFVSPNGVTGFKWELGNHVIPF